MPDRFHHLQISGGDSGIIAPAVTAVTTPSLAVVTGSRMQFPERNKHIGHLSPL